MKHQTTTGYHNQLPGLIAVGLITAAVLLVFAGSGWTLWNIVMEMAEKHWPEWLSLCGIK